MDHKELKMVKIVQKDSLQVDGKKIMSNLRTKRPK